LTPNSLQFLSFESIGKLEFQISNKEVNDNWHNLISGWKRNENYY
jgi:hypothetical protein